MAMALRTRLKSETILVSSTRREPISHLYYCWLVLVWKLIDIDLHTVIKLRVPEDSEIDANDIQGWAMVTSESTGLRLAIQRFIPEGYMTFDQTKSAFESSADFARYTKVERSGSDWRLDYDKKDGTVGTNIRHLLFTCGINGCTPAQRELAIEVIYSLAYADASENGD